MLSMPVFLLSPWQDFDSTYFQKPPLYDPPDMRRNPPEGFEFGGDSKRMPPGYESSTGLDSASGRFIARETVDSVEISYPYELELDRYLELRRKSLQKKMWDSLLTSYDLKKALSGGDIARLIGQATGLTIPIPPNPVINIFGKPEISINVNGEVNIRMGFRWDTQNLGTVSAFGQSQATPMFDQDIRVNVTGRIGDKLKLGTDWNTRRTFDYDNKFKIGYEGYDDDIVKLVEVGNVTLPLQSQLIGGGQALFGVRADFQFGPLFLKTLFSQRRGERRFVDVRGGQNKQPFLLRAYDYAKNHFFLDTAYKSIYRDYFQHSTPVIPQTPEAQYNRVKEIEVWETTNNVQDVHSTEAVAFAYLEPKRMMQGENYDSDNLTDSLIVDGRVERGRFERLDTTRYRVDRNLGTLTIYNLRPDRTYAVAYRIEGASTIREDDPYFGEFTYNSTTKDTLILKLIYRPNLQPQFKTLWDRQMKNIYSINATNVDLNETRVEVWYMNQSNDSTDVLEGAPDKLVTIMGVDQVNNGTGSAPPDGKFDMQPPFFDQRYGEITFPHPEPFREGLREYFDELGNPDMAEQYVFPDVYDTTYDVARRNTVKDRFVITGEVSGRSTNRISLGAFNLAPGSVKVTLDGKQLREYEDYIVDYYAGTLTLRNSRAMLPSADLKIEYEQHDVFNISTRTLAGIRGDYRLVKSRKMDALLGFTVMHYDQSAIIDRVRIGEEPVSNTMLGIDGRLQWETPFITNMLDALPFYDTKAKSSINLSGELAMILPDPNKRRSTVLSDNNEPVVYVDDFEGAQRYISLGLNPTYWSHSSQPQDSSIAFADTAAANLRGKMHWWQFFIPRVPIREVYPNRSVIQGRSNLSPLEINFDPNKRGIYNKNPEFLDEDNPEFDSLNAFSANPDNREKIWAGMQRLFSSFNTNFDTENIEYIEIMMRVLVHEPGKTKMYVDLGQVSEDIIPNLELDTEDGSTPANPLPNDIIDVGEDSGIDGLFNEQEKNIYPYPLSLEDDPARDDYAFDFGKRDVDRDPSGIDFIRYNNFEGNATVSEIGQFPDTEILNKNNGQTISLGNSYFEYEVNLTQIPEVNPQIVGGGNANWYLWRIPIRKPTRSVGNPLFSNIQYIRIWFKGGAFIGQIAEWRLVGSQWQRISNFQSDVAPDDSVMQIAFVNREENAGPPDYYTMPPGVEPPKQLNNPDPTQDIYLNEQSLSVCVENLRYGDERMAVRIFQPLDIFNYKKLKFFIHGDGSMPDNIVEGAIPKAYAFLRFGTDSSNYYEYRRPLIRGWQDININMDDLTAIKQLRDSMNIFNRVTFPVPDDALATFAIKGNPILTRVQFFGIGIHNPKERFPNELTTCMWIDELRLISPERSADWAGVTNFDAKLADLGSVNATFKHSMPNFHLLEERFGDRIQTTNWTVSMQGNLEKFAPKSFSKMKLPITYTHSEYVQNPEYVANSDINLDQAAEAIKRSALDSGFTEKEAENMANSFRRKSQTLRVEDSWALTGVQLGIPTTFFLVDWTLNRMTFGYSYSQQYERSPVVAERFNWMWNLNAKYSTNIPKILEVEPLKWAGDAPVLDTYSNWRFNFLPSSFSAGLDMRRGRTTEQSRFLDFPSPVLRNFSANRSLQFSWKFSEGGFINPSLDYSVMTTSTLVPFELDETGRQRTGSELASVILLNNGQLIDFGQNNQHTQNLTINFKPVLPDIAGISQFFDISGSYNVNYSWQNPLQPDPSIRDVAKNVSYNANLRFNTGIRLKSMADGWFGLRSSTRRPPVRVPGGGDPEAKNDSTDTGSSSLTETIGKVLKTIFLDYDKIDISVTQANSANNPGVYGGTGMHNFWGRGMLFKESQQMYGPSWAYQMGLVSNPHGGYNVTGSDRFPFFGFESYDGLRPPNAVMQDNYSQKTSLTIGTTRPLWEGATLDLNWKTDVGYNRNQTVVTDDNGVPTYTNIIAMESFTRTYLAFPTIFGINLFGSTIEDVVQLYEQRKAEIEATYQDTLLMNQALQNALGESFHDGLEAFSLISGRAGKFLPAINWGLRWEGIEKWGIWDGIAKRVTLEHAYQSQYQENAQITDNGRTVQGQQVQFGFQPLVGITMGFDEEKLNGLLTATFRWNSSTAFQLMSSNKSTISRQSTEEISIQASYTMRGFEFPFLGFTFKNDFEFSLLTSYKSNQRATYDILDTASYEDNNDGRTLDGNTQLIIEPRARYNLSNRVTASLFFRYEGTFTEGAAQPGFSSYQLGLDIRLSISGGR